MSKDPFEMRRVILDCHPDSFILATRAAKWLLDRPEKRGAIIAFGEGKHEVSFHVKRTKDSISVRENH